MAITFISRRKNDHGLRPMIPSKDLKGVANLIEEAFGNELDRSGRAALREMHWMGRWGFFLLWLDFFSPDVDTHLNGFVWVNHGRVIGNVTINRNMPGSPHWFISNVAVSQAYQRQGIARQLMVAAIEFAKEMRGRFISLQVRQGNEAAIRLYHSMGFQYISANSYFYMSKPVILNQVSLPSDVRIRENNLNAQDAYNAYVLARETIPVNIQMEKPLRQIQFRLGLEVTFNNFWRSLIGLAKNKYWVIEKANGEFVATLHVEPGLWYAEHKMSFMVHPDWWGKLEKPLISMALTYLSQFPARPISFQHPQEHPEGIKALDAFGFEIKRTHIWMKLAL